MKVPVGVLALFAVTLAEVDILETSNGREISIHHGPFSLKVSLTDNNLDQQISDDQALLEDTLERSLLGDLIHNALENFRQLVINGNAVIPPLDPLVIDSIGPAEVDLSGVGVTASINNLRAEGLRWFVLDYVYFNPLRLTISTQLTLPWYIITGSYDAEARLAFWVLHRAGGNFRVFINRFEVGVDVRLGTNLIGGHLLLRELDIRMDIAATHIQIDGMTGSTVLNSLINSFVQNLTQDIIQNHLDDASEMISEAIFDAVNDFLKDYTLADILG